MQPTRLQLVQPNRLVINWSDGGKREYDVDDLRKKCPCATCREKRRESEAAPPALLPVIAPEETLPLTITGMEPVGNYAYSIQFSDGHNTGIFALELLQQLGNESTADNHSKTDRG